jgi:hypothetical protein
MTISKLISGGQTGADQVDVSDEIEVQSGAAERKR